MKPNIILITADQMRGDCVEALGHPDIKTPYLNTMINHGAVFTNAYSATPTCIPARAALFTGLSQTSHRRVGYQDCIDWEYENTLPQAFAGGGYHTQCVGKMHVWPPRKLMGFHNVVLHDGFLPHRNKNTPANRWWDRVDDYLPYLQREAGYQADIADPGIDCNSWDARPWPLPEHTHPTNWTVAMSLDFLRRRDPTKPFFLWTSFVAPHPPLLPPDCYFRQYMERELAKPVHGTWADRAPEYPDADCFEGHLKPEEIQRMRAGYYGLITHLDHQIGRLLRGLKDEGVLNQTVILFTSDHGEMLGDHEMFRKSQPFQGSVHVPMILYDPGNLLGIPRGTRFEEIAELRDVMPTLLSAAGLTCPHGVEGLDLTVALKGKGETRSYLHGEHTSQSRAGQSAQYIVTKTRKYIWYSDTGKELLFDLEKDKMECEDVSGKKEYERDLGELRACLAEELKDREEGYSDGSSLITGREPEVYLKNKTSI